MPPKFGTSGLRGLVTELTPDLITDYIRAFLTACDAGTALYLGQDLRPSSPQIAQDITRAARDMGVTVVDCGAIATPALALAAQQARACAVMVTGSHIPADRNGLKFYTPQGEITKADETAIAAHLGQPAAHQNGSLRQDPRANDRFVQRYIQAFGSGALRGKKIGLYSHSAVGRDVLHRILDALGAHVIEFGRSDHFIPVDTEAVEPEVATQIQDWVISAGLDALVSTDGDSDRPLLADERGQIVAGDILGQITAKILLAQTVVTPISSNSGVLEKGFNRVIHTKIGSPYVIATMACAGGDVVGYEANGGFLLGFDAQGPTGRIPKLPTRDCILPIIAVLYAAKSMPVSQLVQHEPAIITLTDRLQNIAPERSAEFLASLSQNADIRHSFLMRLNAMEYGIDQTDGLRITLNDKRILHLRPSGNAPEFRIYVEAPNLAQAQILRHQGVENLRRILATT